MFGECEKEEGALGKKRPPLYQEINMDYTMGWKMMVCTSRRKV